MAASEKLLIDGDVTDLAPERIDPRDGATSSVYVTTGTVTNGSPNVTAVADLHGFVPGAVITGTNIPASTTIVSVDPVAKSIVMSANATPGSGTVTITATLTGQVNMGAHGVRPGTQDVAAALGTMPASGLGTGTAIGPVLAVTPTGGVGQVSVAFTAVPAGANRVEVVVLKQTTDVNGATVFKDVSKKFSGTATPVVVTGLSAGTYKVRVRGISTVTGTVGQFSADSSSFSVT